MNRGITSFSTYIPTLRIDRAALAEVHRWCFPALKNLAKGARALASWDEDVITMGVEAGRGVALRDVGAITFASTGFPFADLQNATLVAAALDLPSNITTLDVGGSLRAGTSALLSALHNAQAQESLVIAADARLAKPGSAQELQFGAGSAAFTVGSDNVIAEFIGARSHAEAFVDHFRATGEKFDYFWEERWVRDEGYTKIVPAIVKALLDDSGVAACEVRHLCMHATLAGVAEKTARELGISSKAVVDNLAEDCGDTGAAHALLMFAAALERAKPGEKILIVGFGAGCDVLLFEAAEGLRDYKPKRSLRAARAAGRIEPHYTKLLSFQGSLDLDWGMRAEFIEKIPLSEQYRSRQQLAAYIAGECPSCGAVQFPQLASCVSCGSFEPLKPRSLTNEPATVATFTADWLQFYPSPPLYFGLIQFRNGARVMMEIVDVDPSRLEVGTPVRMVHRIKSKDKGRHYNRYFWKATPVACGES